MIRKHSLSAMTALVVATIVNAASAYELEISWFSIDGGSGTSVGGVFEAAGSLGQPDAGAAKGGEFELSGGFWPVVEGGTTGCTGSERIAKAKCRNRSGANELKVVLADGVPGDTFTAELADGRSKHGTLNNRGKGKAKFKDQPSGERSITVTWGCGASDTTVASCP